MEASPVMIVGDMNTSLPQHQHLSRHWHRLHPFNMYSSILHDFISNNELIVSNFSFEQVFNYIYFNCSNTSYIDHVFISNHISDTVKSCNIVDSSDNVSDHHPLHTCIALCVPSSVVQGSNNCTRHDVARYPRLDWSNSVKCKMYHDSVMNLSTNLPVINFNSVYDIYTAEKAVDTICHQLT